MKYSYQINGMHCEACVEKIKSILSLHFKGVEVTLKPPLLQIDADKPPALSDLNKYVSSVGKYSLQESSNIMNQIPNISEKTQDGLGVYYPIFLIAIYITGVTLINNFQLQGINWSGWMNQFMAGFFLVFSAFKFLDMRGFAEGYSTYDLLAKHWYTYGYIYPFLELSLGILYLTQSLSVATQIATIILMSFSSLGVINSLLKKQQIQCACLGTLLKVPLSTVTLVEDLMMVALAALALFMR